MKKLFTLGLSNIVAGIIFIFLVMAFIARAFDIQVGLGAVLAELGVLLVGCGFIGWVAGNFLGKLQNKKNKVG